MKKVVIEHQCSKLFANFQRGISITAEAKLKTNYQRIYGKKLKKGHNSGKNKKIKKIKKAILDNQFKHVFANFQLFISITVDASPWPNYNRTFQKGSKRAVTLKKIKIFKK